MAWMGKHIHSLRVLFALAAIAVIAVIALIVTRPHTPPQPVSVPIPNAVTVKVQFMLNDAALAEKDGRLPEALNLYEKVLEQAPALSFVHLKIGSIYFHLKLLTKAEEEYLKALDGGLNDPDLYLFLGYVKEVQGKLEQALEYYAKAELAGSLNPVVYFNMGNVHAQLFHWDKSLESLKRAVILNPGYMDAFVNLSIVSAQTENYSDAQYYLEKAENLGYHAPVQYKEDLAAKLKVK